MVTECVGIGIDWGSSNARAWSFSGNGDILRKSAIEVDLACANAQGFASWFEKLLRPLNSPAYVPKVACGMIGARDGWFEAPYLECPRDMSDWLTAPYTTSEPGLFILPGASVSMDNPDVMRGEETQIFGAVSKGHQGLFCLPGTHSKWAMVEKDTFCSFKTYVTGELYALARQYSVFGQLTEDSEPDLGAFSTGVTAARSVPLLNLMFHARSRVLAGVLSETQSTWFLSGALIGHEVLSANPEHLCVTLIADGLLLSLYSAALGALGYRFSSASAEECTTSALFRAVQSQIEENHG